MKIVNVAGARPNFMKIAPLMRQFRQSAKIRPLLVHTGQHYDVRMSDVFFSDLEIPEPDIHLNVGSGSHARQTAEVLTRFEEVLEKEKPDLVLVVGDVNSTLACSVTAAKLRIPVAHVEAGLRSFDRTMPEEINRLVTDALSDYLFTTEKAGTENLIKEGKPADRIFFTGNVMIDSLAFALNKLHDRRLDVGPNPYALVTLHRPSNVDHEESLKNILGILDSIQQRLTVLFPIHPRSSKMLESFGLMDRVRQMKNLRLMEPLGYIDFLSLVRRARLVLTDSGGIQEETTYLRVPCLTMRENTERPVTRDVGSNTLVGTDPLIIQRHVDAIMDGTYKTGAIPELWDGHAAERIRHILENL